MKTKLHEVSRTPEEAAELLRSLAGDWLGETRTWFEPGVLAATEPARGTVRQLPGSRYVIYEYESSLEGRSFQGVMLFGYNVFTHSFEMAWGDAFHQADHMMFANGPGLEHGFSVTGSYRFDALKPAWGWRTQVEIPEAGRLVITAYNIPPGGQEAKGVETTYRRATP